MNRTPAVQPVARRYTDWAISALARLNIYKLKNLYIFKFSISVYNIIEHLKS
jgi:hypothetical protein